jgi:hypothetical protein
VFWVFHEFVPSPSDHRIFSSSSLRGITGVYYWAIGKLVYNNSYLSGRRGDSIKNNHIFTYRSRNTGVFVATSCQISKRRVSEFNNFWNYNNNLMGPNISIRSSSS